MMERIPSLSSLQEASPVLASIAQMTKNQESGRGNSNQPSSPIMASLSKAIWQRSPGNKDDFWEALQSHYNYLMDQGLIESCKEAKGDLAFDPADLTSAYTWTFTEYMDQYKQILEWLDKVYNEVNSNEENKSFDEAIRKILEEMEKHSIVRKLFEEQGQRLIKKYPNSEKEIKWHLVHLNNRWERLEQAITVKRPQKDTQEIMKDVAFEIRCLRKWLREMGNKLGPLTVYSGWTLEDLELKYKEHQSLQKDIESRGKNVFSVLKLCDNVQAGKDGAPTDNDVQHILRVIRNLEHRWHSVWLRSLEWQYLLEDLINKSKQGLLPDTQLDLSFSDEPLSKYPRLSGEWTGKTLFNSKTIPPEDSSCSDRLVCQNDDVSEDLTFDDMELNIAPDFTTAPTTILENEDLKTRDVGTDCETLNFSATNEKGIMVGSTGIMELKADCDGDYRSFEIIQDIGYSSESSTHLSNDERGNDVIHIYTYDEKQPKKIVKDDVNNIENVNDLEMGTQKERLNDNENDRVNDAGKPYENTSILSDDDGSVNRTGPNCATFYFRHVDTDSECKVDEFLSDIENARLDERIITIQKEDINVNNGDMEPENFISIGLRRRQCSDSSLISRPSPERMNLEFLTDVELLEDSFSESELVGSKCMTDTEKLKQLSLAATVRTKSDVHEDSQKESSEQLPTPKESTPKSTCKRESIQELVEQAERMVQEEKIKELHEHLIQPSWGEIKDKKTRLKEWLRSHQSYSCKGTTALPPETIIDSSCDASGEYTSNDSEDDFSISSDEQNNSVILRQSKTGSSEGLLELPTPTNDGHKMFVPDEPVKVVMRNKKRNSSDRPWSVTELYQLANRVDLTPFSISESALNNLKSVGQDGKECKDGSGILGMANCLRSTSLDNSNITIRKSKSTKSRRRHVRRSDSGSEGVPYSRNSFLQLGGSDRGSQKSPSHRRQSFPSKSHSSGSDSGRKHRSLRGSGGGKSTSHSSGTEQYSSEAAVGDAVKYEDDSDSESEPSHVIDNATKIHPSEELSSLSEQAWDDYQDTHYLSEAYSEKIDEEQIKKLMNFGDDYRAFIESHSDTASQSSYSGIHYLSGRNRGSNSKLQVNNIDQLELHGEDSDSDLEDVQHLLVQSSNQLQYSDNFLRKHAAKESNGAIHRFDYGQLFATCETNIKCLQVVEDLIQSNSSWPANVESNIKAVISGWECLKMQAQDQQQISNSLRKVQQEMNDLRESMNNIDNSVGSCGKQIESKEILERMIQEVQAYLSAMQEKKTTLLTINLQVHSFLSSGSEADVSPLKEEVATLYHMWDQIFERSNNQLQALHGLKATWAQYDAGVEELCATLQKDQKLVTTMTRHSNTAKEYTGSEAKTAEALISGRPKVSSSVERNDEDLLVGLEGLNEKQLAERQAQLMTLQRLGKSLEEMLVDTDAWNAMSYKLNSAAADLSHLQETCRKLNAFALNPPPELPLESKKIRFSMSESQVEASYRRKPTYLCGSGGSGKEQSLLWRVVRAALPFQLAIVVLICIAYLLEPNCCDSINNFSLSFSPQLRYVRGPPPI